MWVPTLSPPARTSQRSASCGTATTARQSPTLATQMRCTLLATSRSDAVCVHISATTAAVPVIASPTGLPFTYWSMASSARSRAVSGRIPRARNDSTTRGSNAAVSSDTCHTEQHVIQIRLESRTAMKKLRIVILRFGTARQEMVLE